MFGVCIVFFFVFLCKVRLSCFFFFVGEILNILFVYGEICSFVYSVLVVVGVVDCEGVSFCFSGNVFVGVLVYIYKIVKKMGFVGK